MSRALDGFGDRNQASTHARSRRKSHDVDAAVEFYNVIGFRVTEYTEDETSRRLWAAWTHRKDGGHDIAFASGPPAPASSCTRVPHPIAIIDLLDRLLKRAGPGMFPFERIVCLTEETVETLYLLGEERRIVGVSGYAVRPPRVRREKPRVSAFISADIDKILALQPDLVLTFSDLQADIVAALIRANVEVHAFNQRDVAGIFGMIQTLGALVGATEKADALAAELHVRLKDVRRRASELPQRPRVYFEEWDEPMISGIGWVSELIAAAGGIDVFAELSARKNAKDRIVTAEQVIAAAPDIIIGSWCGKKFVPARVAARRAFAGIPAVKTGWLREVKSTVILQPGPAALTDGLDQLASILAEWARASA
jgi:iron complex transport system substrate-binding protein